MGAGQLRQVPDVLVLLFLGTFCMTAVLRLVYSMRCMHNAGSGFKNSFKTTAEINAFKTVPRKVLRLLFVVIVVSLISHSSTRVSMSMFIFWSVASELDDSSRLVENQDHYSRDFFFFKLPALLHESDLSLLLHPFDPELSILTDCVNKFRRRRSAQCSSSCSCKRYL